MKTSISLFALAGTLLFASCEEEKKPEPTPQPPAQTFAFLKENTTYSYAEYVLPNNNSTYESITKMRYTKLTDTNWLAHEDVYLPGDTVVSDGDEWQITVQGNYLIEDNSLTKVLDPVLNQAYVYNGDTLKMVAQNIAVTTPKGTFTCNKFIGISNTGQGVMLVDKDYKYPFIKAGDIVSGTEYYYFELINN